ncbi:MAG TPA: hypothetical protein VFP65_20750, partial [Anaeromyxobacteraceae bacterium]|nr:hypothetical protein [Anaeromyxobacteraceae bacterium]
MDGELSRYDPAAALLRLPPELRGADPEGPSLEARARALLVRSLRIPAPAETPAAAAAEDAEQAAFLAPVRGDVGLALDLALVLRAASAFAPPAPGLPGPAGLHRPSFDLDRRRAELAALFAALAGALDGFAAPGHTPEFMRDQPADGVELVVRQHRVEGLVHCGNVGITCNPMGAVGQGEDAGLAVFLVKLVLDLADDL